MVTSSAVVGSSAISSSGSQASAMAIITRCAMPPDNSCGIGPGSCLWLGDAHFGEHLDDLLLLDVLRPVAVEFEHFLDLRSGAVDRVQRSRRLLEDHRDVLAAEASAPRTSSSR